MIIEYGDGIEDSELRIKFSTSCQKRAVRMLKADDMQLAIDSWYNKCLRNYIKYGVKNNGTELTPEERAIVEEIRQTLQEHFEELEIR